MSSRPKRSGRFLIVVAAAYGLLLVAMVTLSSAAQAACGQKPLDLRTSWTAADAAQLWTACGPAGRDAYLRMAQLDLVFPAAGGIALGLLTWWLWRRLGCRGPLILTPVALLVAFDYVENAAVWALLLDGPTLPQPLALFGGLATSAKLFSLRLAILTALALMIVNLAVSWRRRAQRP